MGAWGGTASVAGVGVGNGGVVARGVGYFGGGGGVLGFGAALGLGEGFAVCLGGWDASSSSNSATVFRARRRLLGFVY